MVDVIYLREPHLLFGNGQRFVDPKMGLLMFGPYYPQDEPHPIPSEIRLGVIGDNDSVLKAIAWIEKCKSEIEGDEKNPYLYPTFPGFNKNSPFACEFVLPDSYRIIIKQNETKSVVEEKDVNRRIYKAVNLFLRKIEVLAQRDPKPDVIICALPKKIDESCGISFKTRRAKKRKIREDKAQKTLSDFYDEDAEPEFCYDFRRALKGRAMKFGIPTQIMRYRTLANMPGIEDEATRAWNFCLALYYKAGGRPWRLADVDPYTCYVGISFYRERLSGDENLLVSMAQIFTVSGDSLVLKGEKAEIDKEDRQPHLNENDAKRLLKDAIKTYEEHVGYKPTRVVVHKTSRYTPEEISGFESAVNDTELTLVAFGNRSSNIKAFRVGAYPPIRGTFIRFNNLALLYTTGYVPYLGTYPGPKIPTPLEILEVHGDEYIIRVAKEILALTKLNWNSTKFFSREPITIKFAREVGKILSELPEIYPIQPHYRFYM